mmetsp:Transcript_26612/g.59547  ORF Transcript_26612/g.59547 Transcript_26612/m.59547 type:complete len:220 (-) Transcript_26612:102-761(-)
MPKRRKPRPRSRSASCAWQWARLVPLRPPPPAMRRAFALLLHLPPHHCRRPPRTPLGAPFWTPCLRGLWLWAPPGKSQGHRRQLLFASALIHWLPEGRPRLRTRPKRPSRPGCAGSTAAKGWASGRPPPSSSPASPRRKRPPSRRPSRRLRPPSSRGRAGSKRFARCSRARPPRRTRRRGPSWRGSVEGASGWAPGPCPCRRRRRRRTWRPRAARPNLS